MDGDGHTSGVGVPSWTARSRHHHHPSLVSGVSEYATRDRPVPNKQTAAAADTRLHTRLLTYFPRMPGNSTLRPEEKVALYRAHGKQAFLAGARFARVPACSLTDILRARIGERPTPIHLLKVDVEGAELDVLTSLTAEWWCHVQRVAVETDDVSRRRECVEACLRDHGFSVCVRRAELLQDYLSYIVYGWR
eukprot:scpid79496/ scgid27439/ 